MCDTMAVLTGDGLLFAKNSDRDPNEAQILEWHAPASGEHDDPVTVECTWTAVTVTPPTRRTLLSRPFWMWGAEIAANDAGVVIGNEAVFTDQSVPLTGLTGMDLQRLAIERAATAADAVDLIVALIDEYGQGGGCGHEHRRFRYSSSFIVADQRSLIVLETAGQKWATEEVTRGARSISNELTIPRFAEAHSDRVRTRASAAAARRDRTQPGAAGAHDPGDLMAVLRDHDGAAPRYSWFNGAMAAPCMHAGGVVANSQTTASWVADLRSGAGRHWVTATGAPCTGLFKPVTVDDPVDIGPPPTDRADPASLWWRHERLHRTTLGDYRSRHPLFAAERDATEQRWLDYPPTGRQAFAAGDELLTTWTRRVADAGDADRRPPWSRRYWAARARRSHLQCGPAGVDRPTA